MNASRRTPVHAAVALVLLLAAVVAASPAQAVTPEIFGRITDARTGAAARTAQVLLFDADFRYLSRTSVRRDGVYSVPPPGPGRYHLQVVDGRPAYDTKAYAARLDVPVRVGTSSVQKNVRLRRGGAIGGTVEVRGRPAAHAQVRAISNGGQLITTTADRQGNYALGGLARDDYRVFAYDARHRRVGPSRLVRAVKLGSFRRASFDLRTRPGAIRGFLTLGGERAVDAVTVTAVNRRTGEFWVQKVTGGILSIRGLTAGSYRLQVPDTGGHFGRTVAIGRVRVGRTLSVTVDLPARGGTVSGRVVDATDGAGVPNISIRLSDAQGRTQAELPAGQDGSFRIGGTVRQQSGMTVTVFAYDTINGHRYEPMTFGSLAITDNQDVTLGTIQLTRTPGSS